MRGLATAGRGVRQERDRVSRIGRRRAWRPAAHSYLAGRSTRCHRPRRQDEAVYGPYSCITASDQHQPASSRAMATLATVPRLLR
ncbi:hypothetical protein ACFFX0_30630 [Citricoccus parietis]|uniref:Uncharacterized protein n=1 Tax=Citricoccus parietis TaxID=592307 RepID=A0ABV5G8N0_9MICC